MDEIETLVKMLDSPKASARYDACELLRVAPALDDAALAALQRALEDPDPDVRDAASRALKVHEPAPQPLSPPEAPHPETKTRSSLAVIGLVIGLLSLVAWLLPVCGVPLAIAGVVLGFLSRHSPRRGLAIAAMAIGAIGLVLALASAAVGIYLSSTGRFFGAPPLETVTEQLIAAETAGYAQSHPDVVVRNVDVEYREMGRPSPEDRSNGVAMVQCYVAHISYTTADGSCESEPHNGLLVLVNGQWNYDRYDQIGLDIWAEHGCGDFPIYLAPVGCPDPSALP